MEVPEDNTAVIRMKRDFDAFLSGTGPRSRNQFSLDESDWNGSSINAITASHRNGSAISVQALLDKEREDKLKEAEFITTKSMVAKLQSQILTLETSNKKAKIDYEKDVDRVKQDCERELLKVTDLHGQLQFLAERERQTQEDLAECQQELDKQKRKDGEKIAKLQKENLQLAEDLQQEKDNTWEKVTKLKNELMRTQTELQICQTELEETKSQLRLQSKRSTETTSMLKDLEEFKLKALHAEQQVKELENRLSRLDEDAVVAKAMKSQLSSLPDLEIEIRKLKEENTYFRETQDNNVLLQEEAIGLRAKLERLEERCHDFTKIQVEKEDLKMRLRRWEVPTVGCRARSPTEINKQLAELQTSQVVMLEKEGELQTSLHSYEASIQSVQEKLTNTESQLAHEKARQQQSMDLMKRMQRKLLFVTKEKEGYKRIIDSYESEVTVNVGAHTDGRVNQLEESMEIYRRQVEQLELDLGRKTEELAQTKMQCQQLEQRVQKADERHGSLSYAVSSIDQKTITQLREKIAELEKALELKEDEKHILEARIEQRQLQGDYDPTKLKVLHFKMNPAELAQKQRAAEIERLKTENERLTQRVKLLEEAEGRVEDLTVQVEAKMREPSTSKEIEEVRSQLMSAELKNKRLMEAFKKTSQEFREVCYQLTGYKIDIPGPNQYRLTSMYADSPTDFLVFQQSSSGEIQLLGTEYSDTLKDLLDLYLQKQDSIPAFLSSVTLDLFGRQTMNLG